ncbi:YjiG family protein [Cardiobacterium hominis]|jgi:putative membrane protein|uniref:Arginine/ornithine antiporter ArcD n=1 Tax=Cardiobacterium hominis TaxID=2718 RepID=A0A1C3H4D6_9GAMM|nr:YjiG family protein [Cardiobacterium hominis]SAM64737.1 Arginine/ornithine antiporter ArcD [Cardiobacterium hominis]
MSEPQEKPMLTDVFVSGVKRGWGIATGSMLPNVLMAFILIYVLKLTGILDLIGTVCGPVMKVFGLPGEALMVLLAAWLSMGGGVGVASSLFAAGSLSLHDIAVLAPAMYLMGSQVQYIGRLLGVVGTPGKYIPVMVLISIINALLALLVMQIIV